MRTRKSLCLTKCGDEGSFVDWFEAVRALRQHEDHSYGCTQFVAAGAYMLGSKE